jgi:hypothetical protein
VSDEWDPPISRVVLVAVDGGRTLHMRWERESERMHAYAAQYNADRPQRFRASIEYVYVSAFGPEDVPKHIARYGVARVRCAPFSLEGTTPGEFEALMADHERTEDSEFVSAKRVEHEAREQSDRARERARASATKRREKRDLDGRDEWVWAVAAEEEAKRIYGYVKRTAARAAKEFPKLGFPKVGLNAIRKIIEARKKRTTQRVR